MHRPPFEHYHLSKSFLVFSASVVLSVHAYSSLQVRQTSLPDGWTSIGCYTDTTASRTLRTAAYTDVQNMTIESCIAFCTPNGYNYAGVEYSRECYCDNVIESPGVPASSGCNMPCTGNSAEICGGAGAINIFNKAMTQTPSASIKKNVGTWQYTGCFQDGVNGSPRDLNNQITVPGGVSAESCISACRDAGYKLAGLEYGQECWCDIYMVPVFPAPDSDCNMPCQADSTELCGAGNRLALYIDSTAAPNLQQCLLSSPFTSATQPFQSTLQAVPATGGGSPAQIGPLAFGATSGTPTWYILTVGNFSFDHSPNTYSLSTNEGYNGVFQFPQPYAQGDFTEPLIPNVGNAMVFGAWYLNKITECHTFCANPNPVSPLGPFMGPPVLSVNGRTDLWALCLNHSTELGSSYPNGRLDIVFSPISTSADYSISQCQSVYLQLGQSPSAL